MSSKGSTEWAAKLRPIPLDIIDCLAQLIVGQSRRTGEWMTNFRIIAENPGTRGVQHGFNKEVLRRIRNRW